MTYFWWKRGLDSMLCLSEEEIFDYINNLEEEIEDDKARSHLELCHKCKDLFDELNGLVVAIDKIQERNTSTTEDFKIGKFKLVKLLGQGGMGKVWKAFDPILERHVAIKVMKESVSISEEYKKRFLIEAKLIARMNHVNVVQIYSIGYHNSDLFIVMEFIDGQPLFLPGKEFIGDPLKGLKYFLQVLDGIQAAHEAGIVHRDIKPGNIMLDSKNRIKILDFGIARSYLIDQNLTAPGAIVGTLKYMAPEVALGGKATKQSDIYSLGLVLFEMLTGAVIFKNDNPLVTLENIKNFQCPIASTLNGCLSGNIDQLIFRMSQKNPEARFKTIAEVKNVVKDLIFEYQCQSEESTVSDGVNWSQLETVDVLPGEPLITTHVHQDFELLCRKKGVPEADLWNVMDKAMELQKKKNPLQGLKKNADESIVLSKKSIRKALRMYKRERNRNGREGVRNQLFTIKILLIIIVAYLILSYFVH